MNTTSSPRYAREAPALERLGHDILRESVYLLIPFELLYFAIYFHLKGISKVYKILSLLSLITLWASPIVVPISCGPLRCVQNFYIGIGTMKTLELFFRRSSLPRYSCGPTPPEYKLAFLYITELRYESFTPNHVRVARPDENFNEPLQLAVHSLIFYILQALPQKYPVVLALEIQYAIYVHWTTAQLILRYRSSPALFGPLYLADSLTGFWSETWHNAFAGPCTTLAYSPLRKGLPKLGFSDDIARSAGVLGAFVLMALFHLFGLAPMLPYHALKRVGLFFVINGVGTVLEAMVWRHKKHWLRAFMAWIFQLSVASWTAAALDLPQGLAGIKWGEMCNV